ncbi:RloB family protein [Hydrogenimonas urashimensis]|uniref:RloB family protein n=1 Tax=Hydrogenimonas urashimensis TaxID=2740515 RepID=UPI00191657BF|nr:RloB family protein [Hydrogenimonas urashimensis]
MARRSRKRSGYPARSRRPMRYAGDSVLIVCEGSETEPNYFNAVINFLQLPTAAVKVDPARGRSAPQTVVAYAIEELERACAQGNPYAKVYCVIDKDHHQKYDEALSKVRHYTPPKECATVLCVVPSVPCFEFWILMHERYTTSTFGTSGHKPCDQLIKTHLPGYSKTDRLEAKRLVEEKLPIAKTNAHRALHAARSAGTDDPSTYVHLLIEELEYLKEHKYFKEEKKGCPE